MKTAVRINEIFYMIIFFSFAIFLFSCSNSSGAEIANLSDESLRTISDERENSILWTRELEAVRLTRNYKVNQMVSSKMSLFPEAISFANTQRNFIYPSLEGLGSLDTSAISSEMRSFLDKTCNAISKWNLSSVTMSSASEFSLILFKYDVERFWSLIYKKPFPEIIPPPPALSQEQSTENKMPEPEGIFSSWLYARPFFDESTIEVPVRFYSSEGSLDIVLYVETDSSFSVSQIEIVKMC